jgi:hypothetical protein
MLARDRDVESAPRAPTRGEVDEDRRGHGNQWLLRRLRDRSGGTATLSRGPSLPLGNRAVQRLLQREDSPDDGAAAAKAADEVSTLIDPAKFTLGLGKLDIDLPPPPPAWLAPPKAGAPSPGKKGPPWKPGGGPKKPRAATGKDVMKAIAKIPAVDDASKRLQSLVLDKVRRDYRSLEIGEKAALITTGAVLGGAALAGIGSSPEARSFALDQLNGKKIPVPGVPAHIKFMTGGKEKGFMLTVDVAALIRRRKK